MVFDNKPLSQITDSEIETLVEEHVSERQHLEFKVTINNKEPKEKLELLRDIASLANGGGGYLIIGIKDDGTGKATKFESDLVGDTDRIKQSIKDLCVEHISERIGGLEIEKRIINSNPIVIVRVPESLRTPHMVAFKNRTDFYTRYDDGKREMTIGEIREAFNNDFFGRKLSNIESHIQRYKTEANQKELLKNIESGSDIELLNLKDGNIINDLAKKQFIKEINDEPYFYISITPQKTNAKFIDTESRDIIEIINTHPGSRKNGWNMDIAYYDINLIKEGIEIGEKRFRYLKLLDNGHMEFCTPLDENFCWKQPYEEFKKQPRLYPYTVIEYPVTFIRLYRSIIDNLQINENFILSMNYTNLSGYVLLPYAPGIGGFEFPSRINVYEGKEFNDLKDIPNSFLPDSTAYEIIKRFYKSFNLGSEAIPFYNKQEKKFEFRT